MRMLKNMLQDRRANPRKQQIDFYDFVLEELQKDGTLLTEEIALDLMFVLLFASFETTSLAITAAIKFLLNNPHVLEELTVCSMFYLLLYFCFYNKRYFLAFCNFVKICPALMNICIFIRLNMRKY